MSLKVKIRNSITFRITGWLFLVMTVLMILTFAVFRLVSGSILQKTIRGYLLSSVNENTNKIAFYQDREQADDNDLNDVYIRYKDGWLEIDDDFLDEINDVQSALYTSDGTMLYGKNPIARLMEKEAFTTSRVYRYMAGGGDRYFVYDRKLNGTAMEDLWIRGVVPLWSEERQIEDIFRTSIFFVPVLLLAGIAGTYVTVRQSLMPVKRIEQTASEISRGTDLARRIEIGEVDAESQSGLGCLGRWIVLGQIRVLRILIERIAFMVFEEDLSSLEQGKEEDAQEDDLKGGQNDVPTLLLSAAHTIPPLET